jgi:hypothetical protein
MRYLVRLSVPRVGGWRAWGTVRDELGRQLAEQERACDEDRYRILSVT